MKTWLALLATLPVLAVGSGATASSSAPVENGLIAVRGGEGITILDPQTKAVRVLPKTEELDEPSWSPDGTLLAVTSWADEWADSVYVMKADGSDRRLVLRNASSASWSPDGKQLVVVRDTNGSPSLAIVNVSGSEARSLAGTAGASSPKWSLDGKRIAYIDAAGRIALITPDGDAVSIPMKIEATGVSWSPDSSKLAYDGYTRKDLTGRAVVVMLDLTTGAETTLPGSENGETPTWSPDGDQIAFQSMSLASKSSGCGSAMASELWVMNADGTQARGVASTGIAAYGPASWARALEDVPTSTSTPKTSLVAPKPAPTPTPAPNVATPKPSAVAPTVSAEPTLSSQTASPAPSNQTAAKPAPSAKPLGGANGLIAVRGEGGLYIVDPAAGRTREIPGTARMWAPAWSPSMKTLAVERAEKDGSSSIYLITPDGAHAQLVLANASAPSWSAGGERIFALRNEPAGPTASADDADGVLYSVNVDGTGATPVDPGDADAYQSRDLAWPADGRSIDFFDETSLSGPGTFDSSAATWSPDEALLAFTGALGPTEDESADNGLWVVSADGGTPKLLLSGAVGRPSWAR